MLTHYCSSLGNHALFPTIKGKAIPVTRRHTPVKRNKPEYPPSPANVSGPVQIKCGIGTIKPFYYRRECVRSYMVIEVYNFVNSIMNNVPRKSLGCPHPHPQELYFSFVCNHLCSNNGRRIAGLISQRQFAQ